MRAFFIPINNIFLLLPFKINIFEESFCYKFIPMRSALITIFLVIVSMSYAQDYSNQWEGHFSFLRTKGISQKGDLFLGTGENAFYSYDPNSEETNKITTVNGLSGETISYFYHSNTYDTSVIAYENGLLEIVNNNNETTTVVDILNKPTIAPDKKRINHIYEHNGLVYLSCNFGISTYNLERLEFGDSYFIGPGGSQIQVNQTTVRDNTILAATSTNGIMSAPLNNANIIDFSLWQSISNPTLTNWKSIVTFNNLAYAITNNNIIYNYDGNNFNQLTSYPFSVVDHRTSTNNMVITTTDKVHVYGDAFNSVIEIPYQSSYESKFMAATVINNYIFVGTTDHGALMFNLSGGTLAKNIKPNGPTENNIFSVEAHNNELWAVYGAHTLYYNPYPLDAKGFSHFKNDSWTNTPYSEVFDAKSLAHIAINPFNNNQVFISSFFSGLLEVNNGVPTKLFNHTNSALESVGPFLNPPNPSYIDIRIGKSNFDKNGKLWITNTRVHNGLKAYDPLNDSWESYSFSSLITNPINDNEGFSDVVIDDNNQKWVGSTKFGLIGIKQNGSSHTVKNISLSNGNLPSIFVKCLAIDKDNNLWIGTAQGLRVLYNTAGFFSTANPQAEKIVILDDGIPKELMFGQLITDIVVDGSNNKWIGTLDSGVFYFSPDGQNTIYHFTKDNSPLPSNYVTDISVDDQTGKVYFVTPKGLVSFKGFATKPSDNLDNVYAYPNPVRPNFEGPLTISGLTEKANVKITDISGNLVHEEIAQGGSIQWDMRAFGQHKVASGIYIIMVSAKDGGESTIEKVMIVR